jgi:hypothetical protein
MAAYLRHLMLLAALQSPYLELAMPLRGAFGFWQPDGGEGGIRTHGEFHPTSDFESGALDHSATSP